MVQELEISNLQELIPDKPFLVLEKAIEYNEDETALEASLFDFSSTFHTLGARVISIPPNRAFARHTHPNAYHFIYVIKGTGIMEYDSKEYILKPNQTCLVRRGIPHKLGAGEDGLLAIVVNSPTYENGDPNHVHYLEDEILTSLDLDDEVTSVSSSPMGSAPLVYDDDGKVAWEKVWTDFCDLGIYGGPPHRGTLLEPSIPSEIAENMDQYESVIVEIERAFKLLTKLPVIRSNSLGWLGIQCTDEEMAVWMMKAIIVENILARREDNVVFLPVGHKYHIEKEVKNVVTTVAKTYHYWKEHISPK